MGKKKGGKKGGKKKKASGGDEKKASQEAKPDGPALNLPEAFEQLVTLHFRLRDWDFLDFSLTLPTSTPLFKVRQELVGRHGNLAELAMFKHVMAEENEMKDEMKTLEEYGIHGAPNGKGDGSEEAIYYDFVPDKVDDALLSC